MVSIWGGACSVSPPSNSAKGASRQCQHAKNTSPRIQQDSHGEMPLKLIGVFLIASSAPSYIRCVYNAVQNKPISDWSTMEASKSLKAFMAIYGEENTNKGDPATLIFPPFYGALKAPHGSAVWLRRSRLVAPWPSEGPRG